MSCSQNYQLQRQNYRHRKTPRDSCITSYGVVAQYTDKNDKYFLLIKKRDTYAYISFMRGIWKDVKGIKKLFACLTIDEQQRILNYGFSTLWKDLWIYENARNYKRGYTRAKKKFDTIEIMKPLLKEITVYASPIWEFPKGRKNSCENEMTCAFREFEEETRIGKGLLQWTGARKEIIYQGTDKMMYKMDCFICDIHQRPDPRIKRVSILRDAVSDEVEIFGWFNKQKCKELLGERIYNHIKDL